MLTLVPGVVGGSETYARELCKALARVGGSSTAPSCRRSRATRAGGLATTVVPEYRASRSTAGRIAAMAHAAPGRAASAGASTGLDAIHFPL